MMAEVYPNSEEIVSQIKGVRAAVAAHGRQIATRARANLRAHRDTGDAKIRVERRAPDYLVSLVDPAAYAIEFGHVTRSGTAVQGLYILSNAAQ